VKVRGAVLLRGRHVGCKGCRRRSRRAWTRSTENVVRPRLRSGGQQRRRKLHRSKRRRRILDLLFKTRTKCRRTAVRTPRRLQLPMRFRSRPARSRARATRTSPVRTSPVGRLWKTTSRLRPRKRIEFRSLLNRMRRWASRSSTSHQQSSVKIRCRRSKRKMCWRCQPQVQLPFLFQLPRCRKVSSGTKCPAGPRRWDLDRLIPRILRKRKSRLTWQNKFAAGNARRPAGSLRRTSNIPGQVPMLQTPNRI
jgi:hypothetical protein